MLQSDCSLKLPGEIARQRVVDPGLIWDVGKRKVNVRMSAVCRATPTPPHIASKQGLGSLPFR
jgi:hypothetical protein